MLAVKRGFMINQKVNHVRAPPMPSRGQQLEVNLRNSLHVGMKVEFKGQGGSLPLQGQTSQLSKTGLSMASQKGLISSKK